MLFQRLWDHKSVPDNNNNKKKKKDGGSKGNVHSPGDNFKKMTENILITSAQHTLFSE